MAEVFRDFCEPLYDPLAEASLWALTMKVSLCFPWLWLEVLGSFSLFLVRSSSRLAIWFYPILPEFVAKPVLPSLPISQSFVVKYLSSFIGEQELGKFLCSFSALDIICTSPIICT